MKNRMLSMLACLCLALCLPVTGALAAGPETGGPGPEIPGAEVSGNGGGEAGQEELPEDGLLGVRILWMETDLIRTPLSPDEPPMELSLTAEAFYSDGHTLDVTETAEWRGRCRQPGQHMV